MLHEVAAGDLKPDLMKIISKIGNLLASATGPFAFWKLTSAKPAADSLPFNVEFPADSLLGITFFVQVDDLLVSIQTSLSSLKLQSLLCARLTAVQIRRSRS
jgi:hypothetical protein